MAKLSAFSDEMSHDLMEQVRFLQEEQIRFMEIRFVNGKNVVTLSTLKVKEIRGILDSEGIGLSAVGSPIGKVRMDENFEKHFDLFKRSCDVAHELGANRMRLFSYYPPENESIEQYEEEVIERFHKKQNFLLGSGLKMTHENEARIFGHSAENCAKLAHVMDNAYFELAYDPANFVWGENIKRNMDECWPIMQSFVGHVHVKDWTLGEAEVGAIPGKGDGQIGQLLGELSKRNYKGFITMEPHLSKGEQFGGYTDRASFKKAIAATRVLAEEKNLKLE